MNALLRVLYTCPKCGEDTIPLKDKYLAGIWFNIYCSKCGTRLCASPVIMAVSYMVYFWVAAWFIFLAVLNESLMPVLYLAVAWVILDFFNISSMPLISLRPKKPGPAPPAG